ncbi:MAG: translation initiation factor IF-3 [bacterium]
MTFEGKFKREEKGPRRNEAIRDYEVRLIDETGKMHGVLKTSEAMQMARERGMDLIEVDPNSKPIVAKLMDYGKYKYEMKKKTQEAKKKQINVVVKEVQFRPNIDKHDFDFKVKHIERFIEDGDKVRVCIVFRGRELTHIETGKNLVTRIKEATNAFAIIESEPKLEGRKMMLQLAPAKTVK